jgi:type VI secretion system protein ImpB
MKQGTRANFLPPGPQPQDREMTMSTSIHEKLNKVRKPRVHITYDVETEGTTETRELPFVMGVMGDFSGDPTEPLKSIKDRKFIQIDRENFDNVMRRMAPGLKFRVKNTLKDDGSEIAVDLKFNSMEDFEPGRIIDQVAPLKKLMETRNKLRDLMAKVDSSEELESLLEQILKNEDSIRELGAETGASSGQ